MSSLQSTIEALWEKRDTLSATTQGAPREAGREGAGAQNGRSEGARADQGPRRDGNRGNAPGKGGPRRDDRRGGPPRDRDRSGGPETRTFHEDRPSTAAEDSPFAALMKLKLK